MYLYLPRDRAESSIVFRVYYHGLRSTSIQWPHEYLFARAPSVKYDPASRRENQKGMGGLSELFRYLKQRFPESFFIQRDPKTGRPSMAPIETRNAVHIVDVMTRVHFVYGKTGNKFSGKELFWFLFDPLLEGLRNGSFNTLVICIDWPGFVPIEKKDEQAERDQKSSVDPYPMIDGICFTDDGMALFPRETASSSASGAANPHHGNARSASVPQSVSGDSFVVNDISMDDASTTGSSLPLVPRHSESCAISNRDLLGQKPEVHRFELERVLVTRELRRPLFEYLIRKFKEDVIYLEIPDDAQIFVDYKPEGPLHIRGREVLHDHNEQFANTYGEGDIKTVHWVSKFPGETVVMYGNDCDIPMVGLCYLDRLYQQQTRHAPPLPLHSASSSSSTSAPSASTLPVVDPWMIGKLYWQYPSASCDVGRLYQSIRHEMGMPIRDLLSVAILGGTDFVKKRLISHMIGHTTLIRVVELLRQKVDWWEWVFDDRSVFERMLVQLYTWVLELNTKDRKNKTSGVWDYPLIEDSSAVYVGLETVAGQCKETSFEMPVTNEVIRLLFDRCRFNYYYWYELRGHHQRELPAERTSARASTHRAGAPSVSPYFSQVQQRNLQFPSSSSSSSATVSSLLVSDDDASESVVEIARPVKNKRMFSEMNDDTQPMEECENDSLSSSTTLTTMACIDLT